VRNKQARRQGKSSGVRDTGLRSAVTGGAQLNGFIALFEELLAEAGLGRANVFTGRSETVVPGFYRPTKAWDLVAVAREQLVACIEIKSQAGPSFGNNFNNRVEEAIGNAADFWKAYEQGLYRAAVRPFLGYMMLLEDAPGSTNPVVASEPHFSVLPEFQSASYAIRYKFFGEKLLKDRLYDSVALLMSRRGANKTGDYSEPSPELTVRSFVASLMGRAYALSKQG
jgi:hypothetical protein